MANKIVVHNQPCINPECNSSDGRQIYDTGTSFCFSCEKFFDVASTAAGYIVKQEAPSAPQRKKISIEEIQTFQIRGLATWKISRDVCAFFDVRVGYNSSGEIDSHYYPYNGGKSYKVRNLPKEFFWIHMVKDLFGRDKFAGNGKRLVIVEGEKDTLAVAEAMLQHYKKIYPVVGLSTAKATGIESLLEHRDWIRSFKEVIWCGDEDEAGHEARGKAIKIIGIDKIRLVTLPRKDAHEVFEKDGPTTLLKCIWDAAPYVPSGIITKDELWNRLTTLNEKQSIPYASCLDGVNSKTKGHRGGELTLFISGTGAGKSTLLREDALHILQTIPKEEKIGILALEETPEETAKKFCGMVLYKNPAKEELTKEELAKSFEEVFGDDRIILIDHQGSMNDESLVDKLEYMALRNCKYLYIDHITIMVSEGIDNLVGNEAQDRVMNDLLRLVKRFPDVWIGLVSHLRKALGGKPFEEGRMPSIDDIRGSGSVKQVCHDIVAFTRNMIADNPLEQNTIEMAVLKCRYTGLTGRVPGAVYDYDTGRLMKLDVAVEEFLHV